VVSAKCAQCGQVIEAYSMIVTGALAGPSARSGSGPGASIDEVSMLGADIGPGWLQK
jgi:hypothetical protein